MVEEVIMYKAMNGTFHKTRREAEISNEVEYKDRLYRVLCDALMKNNDFHRGGTSPLLNYGFNFGTPIRCFIERYIEGDNDVFLDLRNSIDAIKREFDKQQKQQP